jgi:hypothetical protein
MLLEGCTETTVYQVIKCLNLTIGLGFDKLNPADTGWEVHQPYSTNEIGPFLKLSVA